MSLVLDTFKDLGFHTRRVPHHRVQERRDHAPNKGELLAEFDAKVADIQDQYDMGLITDVERKEAVVAQWNNANRRDR